MLDRTKNWVKRNPRRKRLAWLGLRIWGMLRRGYLWRLAWFLRQWRQFRRAGGRASVMDWSPRLDDCTAVTPFDAQYFYQNVWATRRIHEQGTTHHVDVGSDLMFVGMLTAVADVTFVDIRPARVRMPRFTMCPGTVLAMDFGDDSVSSLSCLNVVEHIGLGRYGDPIDPQGAVLACRELSRVLAVGGQLFFSTPVGCSRVQFNGERIFSVEEVLSMFPDLELREFSLVDFCGDFQERVSPESVELKDSDGGGQFALGLFLFTKKHTAIARDSARRAA